MSVLEDVDILQNLQQAVGSAVTSIASAKLLPADVKYAGKTYIPKASTPWLEVIFIPNNPTGDFWGTEQNYMGMFRMVLHWPNDNTGAYEPMRLLGRLAAYFTKDTYFGQLQVVTNPVLTGPLEMPSETLYSAALRYCSFRL